MSPSPILSPALSALPGIRHGFFTREGGVSSGVYGTLNCGPGSRDVPADVQANRACVAAYLGAAPERLLTCYQIHSAEAAVVDKPWAIDAQPKADAIVTRTPGLALGALAADCTPILFADPEARVIAAAHSGWKGALAGIVEATVRAMESQGARRASIVAAVGPCISQQAYEVGPEFLAAFTSADQAYATYFETPPGGGRTHFDLPGFVLSRLAAAGVGRIDNSTSCTYADPKRFYSYRRMGHLRETDYGRQISAVCLV